MSKPVDQNAPPAIAQAFGSDCVVIPIASILPVKAIEKTARSSHKYHQIAASIREIGLVEPPVVIQDARDTKSYLLLDGHLRIEVLRDLGQTEVECLVSTDDEAFTYNKRISRLSPVQEQRMIAKAIERNVPRDKIARALDINVRSISRKVQLLNGICEEAIGLLKDKMCPMAVFDVLRKMNSLRQIEAAEFLINAKFLRQLRFGHIGWNTTGTVGEPADDEATKGHDGRSHCAHGARAFTTAGSHILDPGFIRPGSPAPHRRKGIPAEADHQRSRGALP
jgi:hypothetical protein